MNTISIIAKKRDGLELSADEIAHLVQGCVSGQVADYQAAAFLMAGRINGFSLDEVSALTHEMTHSGAVVDLSDIPGIKVDKHSTGGVGDKVSLILLPVVAAAGLKVAKMSGRGLGHTGGTIDKLESLSGFEAELPIERFKQQVSDIGLAIAGQSADLAPADKLFYSLRDVTATVDSIPLIASSIMSKKLATGCDLLLLDVKTGSGALMETLDKSRELAQLMVDIGQKAGIRTAAVISDMNQPLGRAVGNALEVRESLDVLAGEGPADLREFIVRLAAIIFSAADLCADEQEGRALAEKQLDSGAALKKFEQMIAAQNGSTDFSRLPEAKVQQELRAGQSGFVSGFNARQVGEAAMLLGAGRVKKDDVIDMAAGLVLQVRIGDYVRQGDVLAVLHCSNASLLTVAAAQLAQAITISEQQPAIPPAIYGIIR